MGLIFNQITILDITILLLYTFSFFVYINNSIKNKGFYFILLLEHLCITLAYYFYSFNNLADSTIYYLKTYNITTGWLSSFGFGTDFIHFILYPFVHYLELGYLGCFFIFSSLGLIGFFMLAKVALDINKNNWTFLLLLLLSPNLNFWTVAIGKDSLIFFSICFIIYNLYYKKNIFWYTIPLIFIALIRFHILAFIGFSFAIVTIFFNKKIKLSLKILLSIFFLILCILIFPVFIERIGLDDISNIEQYQERITTANMQGGGAIDLYHANVLVKWLAYMFRPLLYDAQNIMGILVSFDNLVWLIVILYSLLRFFRIRKNIKLDAQTWFYILSIFSISIPLAIGLSNLGIAVRQKTMVLPFVFLLIIIFNSFYNYGQKNSHMLFE